MIKYLFYIFSNHLWKSFWQIVYAMITRSHLHDSRVEPLSTLKNEYLKTGRGRCAHECRILTLPSPKISKPSYTISFSFFHFSVRVLGQEARWWRVVLGLLKIFSPNISWWELLHARLSRPPSSPQSSFSIYSRAHPPASKLACLRDSQVLCRFCSLSLSQSTYSNPNS